MCAGCEGRVCDRFVLLAAGRAWHEACLRCSQCQCELQTHLTLYCRDGSIYCQQDYCRWLQSSPIVDTCVLVALILPLPTYLHQTTHLVVLVPSSFSCTVILCRLLTTVFYLYTFLFCLRGFPLVEHVNVVKDMLSPHIVQEWWVLTDLISLTGQVIQCGTMCPLLPANPVVSNGHEVWWSDVSPWMLFLPG